MNTKKTQGLVTQSFFARVIRQTLPEIKGENMALIHQMHINQQSRNTGGKPTKPNPG